MCGHCDWQQALTDIKMLVQSDDTHILDVAQLERIKTSIEVRQCVTPGQKADLLRWCERVGCDRGTLGDEDDYT